MSWKTFSPCVLAVEILYGNLGKNEDVNSSWTKREN